MDCQEINFKVNFLWDGYTYQDQIYNIDRW